MLTFTNESAAFSLKVLNPDIPIDERIDNMLITTTSSINKNP
tara:strand:- start:4140 stop:4265 length:126 start_codon:yes stop_codon:yes gene_type:complete